MPSSHFVLEGFKIQFNETNQAMVIKNKTKQKGNNSIDTHRETWSLHLSIRSREQLTCSTLRPTPDLSQCIYQGDNDSRISLACFLMAGKPWSSVIQGLLPNWQTITVNTVYLTFLFSLILQNDTKQKSQKHCFCFPLTPWHWQIPVCSCSSAYKMAEKREAVEVFTLFWRRKTRQWNSNCVPGW